MRQALGGIRCIPPPHKDSLVQSKTASGLVEVYVVLDAGLMYRSQQTIMREEAGEEVVVLELCRTTTVF